MKTIYKLSIFYPLLMLGACASEDSSELDAPLDTDSPRIVVFGGTTAPGVTRADEFPEPSNYGICNANKVRILPYKVESSTLSASDLKPYAGFSTNWPPSTQLDLELANQLNYRDKWTSSSELRLKFEKSKYVGYAFPAIAFRDTDDEKFKLMIPDKVGGYVGTILNVTKAEETPELYYGRLKPKEINNDKIILYDKFDKYGLSYIYGKDVWVDCQLEGSLYRIVSKLNVDISEINPNVKKLEMVLSNVPITIGLNREHRSSLSESQSGSDHGFYYPVLAAADDPNLNYHCENATTVCSMSHFEDGRAHLSTFLLPSSKGRTVTINATIHNPTNDRDTVISRTLRAGKDYKLDLPTSKVYYSQEELPVYTEATYEFMSYSNVRVNVSGKFSDIFSEQSKPNVVIEICPYYDGQHDISIN